jgi:cytochrome c-type biogenesis protein CcmH
MSWRALAAASLLMLAKPLWAIDPAPPLDDALHQTRYVALIHELRCLQCQGENIADTPAQFAIDIRRQVREMVVAGQSDNEIRQYMVDRYGEIILLRPRWTLRTGWLWVAPGLFVLGGVFVAWRILRQRRELLGTDTSSVDDEVEPS